MDRTVVAILSHLRARAAADVTIVPLSEIPMTPKARIAHEQMRARGDLRGFAATHGALSTTITLNQRNALKRAGAIEK
jgi:hypothetical protein